MNNPIKHSVDSVWESSDYDSFIIMKDNRNVVLNSRKIDNLRKSMATFGQIIPGIVNEKNEIIDGQHRLTVAKLLRIPFKFIIYEGLTIASVIEVNNSQKAWTMEDYMNSYIAQGNTHYMALDRFHKNFDKLSLITCRVLLENRSNSSNTDSKFSEGGFVVNPKGLAFAIHVAAVLYKIAEVYKGYNKHSFVSALLCMFNTEGFKEEIFLNHLSNNRQGIYDCINRAGYLRCLEELYNYGMGKNRIRLI